MSALKNENTAGNHLLNSTYSPDFLFSGINTSPFSDEVITCNFPNTVVNDPIAFSNLNLQIDAYSLDRIYLSEDKLITPLDIGPDLNFNQRSKCLFGCESLAPLPTAPTKETRLFLDYGIAQMMSDTSSPQTLRSRSCSVSSTSISDSTTFDENWATLIFDTLDFNENIIDNHVTIVSPNKSTERIKFIIYEPSTKGPKLTPKFTQPNSSKVYVEQALEQEGFDKNVNHNELNQTHAFKCTFSGCSKSFSRQYNLTSHMRSHSNLRPHSCGFCSRSFARKHDLQRHTRLHTGNRPYGCIACYKSFPRSDALSRHYRVEEKCRAIHKKASS